MAKDMTKQKTKGKGTHTQTLPIYYSCHTGGMRGGARSNSGLS